MDKRNCDIVGRDRSKDDYISQDGDTSYYQIDFESSEVFGAYSLNNGESYTFSIVATDDAGNKSFEKEIEASIGSTVEGYDPDNITVVEYETLSLIIEEDSLPEDVKEIVISETVSQELEDKSSFPIVSPIYSLNVINNDGKLEEHVEFENEFYCELKYEEAALPENFPETSLGVYYYDSSWSKWFKVDDAYIDADENMIGFNTNHFTDFAIQPTVVEDLSPQEMAAIEFSPFSENTAHQDVRVLRQSGGFLLL